MNRLRYLALVALLLLAILGPPAGYAWASRNEAQRQHAAICKAVNKVIANQIGGWDYLAGRVRATHPAGADDALTALGHLRSLSAGATCK